MSADIWPAAERAATFLNKTFHHTNSGSSVDVHHKRRLAAGQAGRGERVDALITQPAVLLVSAKARTVKCEWECIDTIEAEGHATFETLLTPCTTPSLMKVSPSHWAHRMWQKRQHDVRFRGGPVTGHSAQAGVPFKPDPACTTPALA